MTQLRPKIPESGWSSVAGKPRPIPSSLAYRSEDENVRRKTSSKKSQQIFGRESMTLETMPTVVNSIVYGHEYEPYKVKNTYRKDELLAWARLLSHEEFTGVTSVEARKWLSEFNETQNDTGDEKWVKKLNKELKRATLIK